jgi:hypothetical protein
VSPYALRWFGAFALTIAVELVVAVPLLEPSGAGRLNRAGIVALVNLATHPLVWFLFPALPLSAAERLASSESFALFVETIAYMLVWPKLRPGRAFATSALANGASLAVGLSSRALGLGL